MFIHLLWQFLRGHGIQTEGERGDNLRFEMQSVDVKRGMSHDWYDAHTLSPPERNAM